MLGDRRNCRRALALAAGLSSVALAVGCTDTETRPSQALWSPGDGHRICVSSRLSHRFTEGLDLLANRGPAPVTIDGVDWLSQHGVRPLDISYVQHTPQNRYEGIGAIYGFPPHAALTDPRIKQAWDQRKPLEGSTLAPNNGRSSFTNVFIGFTGTSGSAGPLRVRYTDASGRQGVVRSHIRVVVRPLCD